MDEARVRQAVLGLLSSSSARLNRADVANTLLGGLQYELGMSEGHALTQNPYYGW